MTTKFILRICCWRPQRRIKVFYFRFYNSSEGRLRLRQVDYCRMSAALRCHILFKRAFSALQRILEVITLVTWTIVSNCKVNVDRKMHAQTRMATWLLAFYTLKTLFGIIIICLVTMCIFWYPNKLSARNQLLLAPLESLFLTQSNKRLGKIIENISKRYMPIPNTIITFIVLLVKRKGFGRTGHKIRFY